MFKRQKSTYLFYVLYVTMHMYYVCEKLTHAAEYLLHNAFCHSTRRQSELQQFKYFIDTEPHKLLRTSVGFPFIPVFFVLLNSRMH